MVPRIPPACASAVTILATAAFLLAIPGLGQTVPTDLMMPGTQPLELGNLGGQPTNCDNCHGSYDPAVEPAFNWQGGMMAHATRDPLFWATVAVAERDFTTSGDLCIRCHSPRGWLEGRSTPTDGSALLAGDAFGTECILCHKLTNPDTSEYLGVQNAPFLAHDEGAPPTGYYGSGMFVVWGGNERLGPYNDAVAQHPMLPSQFHRSVDFCGTCHDVSNPLVGDLAHNHGAQVPLQPGTFSGVPGAPVDQKAAFNNFPYQYGIVERTFSEYKASAFPTTLVAQYDALPADLKAGAIQEARQAALLAGTGGHYADGTPRYFSCQTCHMRPTVGVGCDRNGAPLRHDLPLHDLTGGNDWTPDAMLWLDAQGRILVGGGLDATQVAALQAGKLRARHNLESAARLEVTGDSVRVTNLTGHKLISGFPEGRRMWLRATWRDAGGALLREDGAYGAILAEVDGVPTPVDTLLDLSGTNTRIWEVKMGMTQEWGAQLVALGLPTSLPLAFDRVTGAVTKTLGALAAQPPGTASKTLHMVLSNTVIDDNRIPPYGMSHDAAVIRNVLPVPATRFGDPGPGGTYEHFDVVPLAPPPGAATAVIELLYQPTSWEYVQFLHLGNDGTNAFLGATGGDLLDAWLNTGMAAPHVMASATWSVPAAATVLGTGCGGPTAAPPLLQSTLPVLGSTLTLSIDHATASRPGILLASAPPATPLLLGSGCTAWIDVGAFTELLPVATDPTGSWALALPLPPEPGLAGFGLVLQGVVFNTTGPFGLDLTNGLEIVLGS